MSEIISFELKKILRSKTAFFSVVFILIFIFILSSEFIINEKIQKNENILRGFSAISVLNDSSYSFTGNLTEEKISKTIKNHIKNNTLNDVERTIISAFSENQDISIISKLMPEDSVVFYDKYRERISKINGIYNTNNFNKQNKIISEYEKVKQPFYYEYSEGWKKIIHGFRFLIPLLILLIGISVSSVFSSEFSNETEYIIFSSKYKKSKIIFIKILAAVFFSSLLYLISVIIYTSVLLLIYGYGGYNLSVQMLSFISPYGLNIGGLYVLSVLTGYISMIEFVFIIFLISTFIRKPVYLYTISALLMFLPLFITQNSEYLFFLFPVNSSDIIKVISSYTVYGFFGKQLNVYSGIILYSVIIAFAVLTFSFVRLNKYEKK
ncbi:MAG: hypothetical protein H7A31_04320 [Thermotogae bacterium]|nr:hypothetical protein [Thermotogota bacterium]HOO74680.1 hypothetical protein [Tepiditoga sp.]